MNRPFGIILLCFIQIILHSQGLSVTRDLQFFLRMGPSVWPYVKEPMVIIMSLTLIAAAGLIAAVWALMRHDPGRKALVAVSVLALLLSLYTNGFHVLNWKGLLESLLLDGGTVWYFTRPHVRDYYRGSRGRQIIRFASVLSEEECVRRFCEGKYRDVKINWKGNGQFVITRKIGGRDSWALNFFGTLIPGESGVVLEGYMDFPLGTDLFSAIWLGMLILIAHSLLINAEVEAIMLLPFAALIAFGGGLVFFGRRSGRKKMVIMMDFIENSLKGERMETERRAV